MNWKLFPLKVLAVVAVLFFSLCASAHSQVRPESSEIECREGRHYILKVGSSSGIELQSPTFNLSAHLESLSPDPDPDSLYRYIASIPVFVMADQSFRSQHPDWKELMLSIVERADDELYRKSFDGDGAPYFDIDMTVMEYMEWESTPDYAGPMLEEAIAESWSWRTKWSPYQQTVVVAYTGVSLAILNEGPIYARCDSAAAVIIANSVSYWEDDNVLMHEFSHLFYAHDHFTDADPHFHDDCMMSYEKVWVEFVFEDFGVWFVHDYRIKGVTTKNFCSLCHFSVFVNAFRFNPPQIHNGRWYKQ